VQGVTLGYSAKEGLTVRWDDNNNVTDADGEAYMYVSGDDGQYWLIVTQDEGDSHQGTITIIDETK
jgi:hypothetical protein